ncbi:DUF2325 domain-containing protein [Nitrosomonas sp. HPC101]|uniref:DUF2325 domain-containing protein n=1 Tax=Nitrosomonas sp. HPC101 TaxID=1658667 RepID=UPI00136DCCB2
MLKQLYSLIRSALSCVSFKNFTHSKALIDCHVNPDISKTQNDISLRWIKSDRPYPYPFNAATDRLKRKRGYLLNQPVLCVGGRADYRRLIEAAGGRFMAFRSSTQNHVSCLITLLDCAHTVICPADCISHNDFFTVKHYCQYARKNCVMLERSDLATFRKAVNILSRDNCYPSYRSG